MTLIASARHRDDGALLGWLIDPYTKRVEVYRPEIGVEVLEAQRRASGDPVLPGFELDLDAIW